jgi:hypothetical protein
VVCSLRRILVDLAVVLVMVGRTTSLVLMALRIRDTRAETLEALADLVGLVVAVVAQVVWVGMAHLGTTR